MSVSEDLINFDIIETQKENIQPLASGRSAKALLRTLAPVKGGSTVTPGATRNLNDTIREEFETELQSIQTSDDPLDIYDRYIKWTLSAYPSAQATTEAGLRPLLERATKAFQSVNHCKNDPRYLKMWLHYIQLFSDDPRETFNYLARHGIGEGLALFYEEFAKWLETAGRWSQADEILKMGIEREARPTERLLRKYSEFCTRFEARPLNESEPSSPAISTIRPALAAKVDPFAASQPSRPNETGTHGQGEVFTATGRSGRQKLAIFSDKDESAKPGQLSSGASSGGWNKIGTVAERKKENIIEARPWAGEKISSGRRGQTTSKMTVFKDGASRDPLTSQSAYFIRPFPLPNQASLHGVPSERVFVHLSAVYPSLGDVESEYSFEELRARSRGWLAMKWTVGRERRGSPQKSHCDVGTSPPAKPCVYGVPTKSPLVTDVRVDGSKATSVEAIGIGLGENLRISRQKKTGFKEVRGETQTIKTNLQSPIGPRLRRKHGGEPTMTIHTKAATEDILDIFNQPLRNHDPMIDAEDSEAGSDGDEDDGCEDDEDIYTSGGESTGTDGISFATLHTDTEPEPNTIKVYNGSDGESVSPWSDFSTGRHVPDVEAQPISSASTTQLQAGENLLQQTPEPQIFVQEASSDFEASSPSGARLDKKVFAQKDYVPPPNRNRETATFAQNRFPYMTPIIERTETLGSIISVPRINEASECTTPSRKGTEITESWSAKVDLSSSLSQEEFMNVKPTREGTQLGTSIFSEQSLTFGGPLIQDIQCNPVDDSIRSCILNRQKSFLKSRFHFYDYEGESWSKTAEIRKYIKSITKTKSSEKTTTPYSPPVLCFPGDPLHSYQIRRELGKGAFAPVYLAEETSLSNVSEDPTFIAIKSEEPPTAWEFYIMTILQSRLAPGNRDAVSFLRPISLHLFQDEGFLLEEYRSQGTLLDLVNLVRADPILSQNTVEESVAMFFAVELIRTVCTMHSLGVLHGDLKADNCLVRLDGGGLCEDDWANHYQPDGSAGWSLKGLTLIDFGRSIDLTKFRPDVQFVADWKTGKQDCVEMRELRPWTYQVDYFGMAGIIHFLLFGKYIEDVTIPFEEGVEEVERLGERKKYRIKEGLKRYWQTELWSRFFTLTLNPLCHIANDTDKCMPILGALQALQRDMEQWLVEDSSKRSGGLKASLVKLELKIRERRGK